MLKTPVSPSLQRSDKEQKRKYRTKEESDDTLGASGPLFTERVQQLVKLCLETLPLGGNATYASFSFLQSSNSLASWSSGMIRALGTSQLHEAPGSNPGGAHSFAF